jgi:integrase
VNTLKVDLPHLSEESDRHGNVRLYVRRHGRRIRLRVTRGSKDFAAAYAAALDKLSERAPVDATPQRQHAPRGSLGWLATLYFGSDEFRALDPASQTTRRAIIEGCLRETIKDDSADLMRDCPLSFVTTAKIKRLRDFKKDKPAAANNRRKYLSAVFGWGIENGHASVNPVRDVRRLKYVSEGFHTWTVEEVRQFIMRHPIGTKAYLALCLLLFVGVRRGDLVQLGKQHINNGWLRFAPRKTLYKRTTATEKPILAPLAAALAAGPVGDLTFVVTEYGLPFTANGFGGWFRDRCDEAGLPQCSAHGLRKAGATILAEHGATEKQLMAAYDWSSSSQAAVYTKAANQKRLAGQVMPLLMDMDGEGTDDCLTAPPRVVSPQ